MYMDRCNENSQIGYRGIRVFQQQTDVIRKRSVLTYRNLRAAFERSCYQFIEHSSFCPFQSIFLKKFEQMWDDTCYNTLCSSSGEKNVTVKPHITANTFQKAKMYTTLTEHISLLRLLVFLHGLCPESAYFTLRFTFPHNAT